MLAQVGADGIASQDPEEFRKTIDNDPLSYCDDGTIESYGRDVVIKAYFAETDDGVIRMGAKSEEFANPDGVGMIYGSITDKELPTAEAMDFIKQRLAEIGEFLDIGEGFSGFRYVDDEDWANNWKSYYEEFRLSDRIVMLQAGPSVRPAAFTRMGLRLRLPCPIECQLGDGDPRWPGTLGNFPGCL